MALNIETFTNKGWRPGNNSGGSTLFKALGHPLTAVSARDTLVRIAGLGAVAVYDPLGQAGDADSFFNLTALDLAGVFVQNFDEVGKDVLGCPARAATELSGCDCRVVLVCAFDADRLIAQIAHLLPVGAEVVSFDAFRLPGEMLTNSRDYLDPLNFVTNFGFLKETGDHHTRIMSVNYWGTYGAKDAAMWLKLFGEDGQALAEWTEPLPGPGAAFTIDSADIAQRFGLGSFTGSLFMHAIRVAGHDILKYVIDTYGDNKGPNGTGHLSATHDANPWPADLYAGLPSPAEGERVILWIQNSHPVAIPVGEVGFNLMGSKDVHLLDAEVAAFGCYPVDVGALMPEARWPDQIEIKAGRYFVRPRYEVADTTGRIRLGHVNVERTDLVPDPHIPDLGATMGKGYILPLPILPLDTYAATYLPTPMTTAQQDLPIALAVYDASGAEVARRFLGRLARRDSLAVKVDDVLAEAGTRLESGFGHAELMYDFRDGGEADGWLHALARFEARAGGHVTETTFGAHIYNTAMVYRDEPQSYTTRPPGLTTRLFLRLGPDGFDAHCHLIYPASLPWHARSKTRLTVFSAAGEELTHHDIEIPCGGSLYWRMSGLFDAATCRAAEGGYVVIRDVTCRLFGFHGLARADGAFSLDHTFGF
ncbi:MAG: hypothetical protein ACI82H_000080 [Alphaproteobacteria bacterium]|jgi:hypothetical protein